MDTPSPRRYLLINPNTNPMTSQRLQEVLQPQVPPGVLLLVQTARFGAPYIADEASYAVAGYAVMDAWAAALAEDEPAPDAVLIGCFGDPGLLALQDTSAAPVTGLAEAAFIEAAACGRFAVVTGGERWKPILQRLAHSLGHSAKLTGVHTVAPTGALLAQAPGRSGGIAG